MILGFVVQNALAGFKRRFTGETTGTDANRMKDMLSRERVTLHMTIERVHSNSLS